MKSPINTNIQTLEDHREYAKGNTLIISRLEICYYLSIPLLRAYELDFWE